MLRKLLKRLTWSWETKKHLKVINKHQHDSLFNTASTKVEDDSGSKE